MKHKKKPKRSQLQRIPLAPLRPKGVGMKFTQSKSIHLTGGGWAA